MPMLRAIRMLNAVEAGTTSGAQLETLLADAGRLAEWNVLINQRGQARRIAASSTAMTAVAASSTAMTAVIASSTARESFFGSSYSVGKGLDTLAVSGGASTNSTLVAQATMTAVAASSTAMTAVIASSTAMAAVAASSTAMTAVAASSTAMTAVWASNTAADAVLTSATAKPAVYNDNTALAALQTNPTQVARQIGISGRTTAASTAISAYVFVANGTKVILLRRYYSSTESDMIDWARGSTTAAVGQGPVGGSRNLDTSAQALGCISGTYTSNGIMPTANDDTANFVSAANGLQRRGWTNGNVLYVNYILV